MSSIWGNRIKISIFGESHSNAIGGVLDGLPAGIKIDFDEIMVDMDRRAPGKSNLSTTRKEGDIPEILSGYFNGYTTGTPLAFIIKNSNTKSSDYDELKNLMRPGHGDYSGNVRYRGYNDYRGGGHFSGRLTAPLVFMGSVAKQYIMQKKGIYIFSRVKSIGDIVDDQIDFGLINDSILLKNLRTKKLPTINEQKSLEMEEYILQMKKNGDSTGGVIECTCINVPTGLGSPFFESFESSLSHLIFSIPSVKGIEFGRGFDITKLSGSQANDEMSYDGNTVKNYTNNNGGITGGITNGMPIVFRVAIKPTPSIAIPQRTINIEQCKDEILSIKGRHDPCIVPRALPVVEACAALNIFDYLIQMEGINNAKSK
ncbi:chorismate synthase [Alkalibaculum sp. M08DMB]|uniref:Chorismate synthase n=1 Tax=Alkalibaculum sporogenes TaxID=2655001 RepID=A0A6A7K9V1_9FIRM|nr:chorismate synthase [Alkalibaculum sporogenes]MPW26214.1 chorismate synthase [Alkalibaculum sporogenes]